MSREHVDHYIPLFGRDFLTATAGWTASERGHYITLLIVQWEQGCVPAGLDRLELVSPARAPCGLCWRPSFRFAMTASAATLAWSSTARNRRNSRQSGPSLAEAVEAKAKQTASKLASKTQANRKQTVKQTAKQNRSLQLQLHPHLLPFGKK